jgi:arylformamidase
LRARIEIDGRELTTDLSRPRSIGIDLRFDGQQPRHFGAPVATARPFCVPGFPGDVRSGASCNCAIITMIPHCNGTHTEGVGHLTVEQIDTHHQVPAGLLAALLVSVHPVEAGAALESSDPPPQSHDTLITRHALERGWPRELPFRPRAMVIRTLPNDPRKIGRDYSDYAAPYLSREAAEFLVARDIEHVVVDLPSLDRSHDGGRLSAHRIFFGLPPGSRSLGEATRSRATITELAFIPEDLRDGPYLLEIQAPAIGGDAVPSRPLLYELT